MWQFDESAARFPPPRAEEPANLRREIVAELTDHLTCARRREQMAGDEQTEEAVRRRVLDRFGDPAAVARKLWLDWMWERIMSQRILVATCVLMVVLSCVALGLAWASLKGQQDLMATWQTTSETQMRDQQKLFERLLAQSEKALSRGESKTFQSVEWNPVELKFVSSTEDGAPLAGVKANLSPSAEGSTIPSVDGVSDAEGIVRFERVHYGNYRLYCETAAGERATISLTQQPGAGLSKVIVCPESVPELLNVNARIDWPDDLATRPLWFRFQQSDVYRKLADRVWRGPTPLPAQKYSLSVMIEPEGSVLAAPFHDARQISSGQFGRGTRSSMVELSLPVVGWNYFADIESFPNGMAWPKTDYVIGRLEVLIPARDISSADELRKASGDRSRGSSRSTTIQAYVDGRYFGVVAVDSGDWSYRIESGMADKPGTLWLTPTAAAVKKVREALGDQARDALEKAQAEAAKATAEAGPAKSAAAPDAEKKNSAESDSK